MNKTIQTLAKSIGTMAIAIKIEEAALTAVSIYFLTKYNLGLPVWVWVLLFFSPDVSALGYLINPRVGAYTYNLFHHRAVGLTIVAVGFLAGSNILMVMGILLFAHSSFDRMMGYGLKYDDSFQQTSLGWIGKNKK